jgi:hypothetical protein
MLSGIMLDVAVLYAECQYTECCNAVIMLDIVMLYVECHNAEHHGAMVGKTLVDHPYGVPFLIFRFFALPTDIRLG